MTSTEPMTAAPEDIAGVLTRQRHLADALPTHTPAAAFRHAYGTNIYAAADAMEADIRALLSYLSRLEAEGEELEAAWDESRVKWAELVQQVQARAQSAESRLEAARRLGDAASDVNERLGNVERTLLAAPDEASRKLGQYLLGNRRALSSALSAFEEGKA